MNLTDAQISVIEKYVGNYRNDPVKDLHAVYSKMVGKGEWDTFFFWVHKGMWVDPWTDVMFAAWLSCYGTPDQIPERMAMAAEWIEGRKG